jgi:hypothetical protein
MRLMRVQQSWGVQFVIFCVAVTLSQTARLYTGVPEYLYTCKPDPSSSIMALSAYTTSSGLLATADLVRFILLEADQAEEKAKRLRQHADALAHQYGHAGT